jgi:hypothetical protein
MSLGGVRERMEELLERAADAVKDALLDWELDDEAGRTPSTFEELPPLDPVLFVAALLPQLEDVLWRMAEAVNAAPTGRILAVGEERVRELLADFCYDALEQGLQMRLDAAEAARPAALRPRGAWARRWRRMHAAGTLRSSGSSRALEASSDRAHP